MRPVLGVLARRVRPLAAAAALALAGLGGTAAPAAAFTVANPYASGLDDSDIRVRKMIALLSDKDFQPPLILTRWGEGYLLRGDDAEEAGSPQPAVGGARRAL